jgi:hypothetical protein
MKKFILILAVMLTYFGYSYSQEIGLRFGNISGGSVAIDGVFSTSKFSRIHADLSFGDGVGIDVLWDFLYMPVGREALNWYVGAGPYMKIADPFWLGVAGEIGLEYRFKSMPIALGFDWRPQVSIIESTDLHLEVFGINLRYVF